MFDLKAKLLEKGLVTKEHVEKITAEKQNRNQKQAAPFHPAREDFAAKERVKALNALKSEAKADQYLTIRKWVDINRLDKTSHSLIDCEKFFLTGKDNQVSWLSLKKEVVQAIGRGDAGVIAYMSNHGLTHAVVPRDIAEDVSEVFPDWLKVLNDKN